MATSGSITHSSSTQEIVTEALELMGVLGEGESPTTDQLTSVTRTLNNLVKSWQAKGLNLFAVQKLYVFLEKDKKEYPLSASSTTHFSSSLEENATTVDALSGAFSIIVTDGTVISSGDTLGVFLDTGVMHWTTVSGAPTGNSIPISAALPEDVSTGATVYTYSTKANRPMRVLEAYTHTGGTDIPAEVVSRVGYWELANKDSSGVVNQVYYDPQIGTGTLSVWPTTSSEKDYLILQVQRTLEDFINTADEPDYPQEWFMPLSIVLAWSSAPKYGIPLQDYNKLQQQATFWMEEIEAWDTEQETSVFFQPDSQGRNLGG